MHFEKTTTLSDLRLENDELLDEEVYVDYDIATYPSDFTLQGIVDMWLEGDITIPEFQREYVWTIKQASLLVDSFLMGLPVPPVFFYIDEENRNLVIDGQQRILTIVQYFEGYFGNENFEGRKKVFRLQGIDNRSPFHKKRFHDLDEANQRKLRNTVLRAINIRQLAPVEGSTSAYHIFERLNTGGTPLRPQEIRNVVFRGAIVDELRRLNLDPNWRRILGSSTLNKHQADVELVLRVFSLSVGDARYEKPMKEFLNRTMKQHREARSGDFEEFKLKFPHATKKIIDRLGEKPFHLRGMLNTAALDAVFVTLVQNLDRIPSDLKERFSALKNDKDFLETTKASTTNTAVVRSRLGLARTFLVD